MGASECQEHVFGESPRSAAIRDRWCHRTAEEPESAAKRVPAVCELVAELVEFAPPHCKSVGELGVVEVVKRQLATQVFGALLGAEDFDLVVVDVRVCNASPLSPANM